MDNKKRGIVEIVLGIILFAIVLAIGIWAASSIGARYAPELGYLYILSSVVVGLVVGLLSGALILSGYLRASDKRQ